MTSYDSNSSTSPTSTERHRLRRKRSPSPSQHFSVNPFASHRPYSPSTRASDIARLLDPSYASPSNQSPFKQPPSTSTMREVYVDHHGDLHDPDFRDFPTFIHKNNSRWHRSYDDDDEDDDQSEDDKHNLHLHIPKSIDLQRRRPYYTAPTYYPYDEPSSYESRHLAELGGQVDEKLDHHERTPLKDKCRISRPKSPHQHTQSEKHFSFPHDTLVEEPHSLSADSDSTPTCGHAMRRQWHAFTLSLRFSLFRTKRRIQRKMSA